MSDIPFRKNDCVTNDRGWSGKVVEVKDAAPIVRHFRNEMQPALHYLSDPVVLVDWQERRDHEDPFVRKQPIIAHRFFQVWKI